MEFINLKSQYLMLQKEINKNIFEAINQSQFIGGAFIDELEIRLANYVGRKYCITCASGTDALRLACTAYGFQKKDAIFCPDMTFIASIEPACTLGATPVFCDIDPISYNIEPLHLEQSIIATIEEGKYVPKAVIAVDFLGNPADFDQIEKICQKYNLILIEDAAQAIGASYKNKKCGAFGEISCTSFFPSKPLGGYGDGGAVFTDSDEIANCIKSLKNHGKGISKYDNVRIGFNSRLDNLQAAILLPKLEILDSEIIKRQEVANIYSDALKHRFCIPHIRDDCISAYAQYCLLAQDTFDRERIINTLKKKNIPSLIYYPNPLHSLKVFSEYNGLTISNATDYSIRNFGIPFSPYLTADEQALIIEILLSV